MKLRGFQRRESERARERESERESEKACARARSATYLAAPRAAGTRRITLLLGNGVQAREQHERAGDADPRHPKPLLPLPRTSKGRNYTNF